MNEIIFMAVAYLIRFLDFMIFVRIVLSWLPINRNNPIINFIYMITEPILGPIRNLIAKSPLGGAGMMLDFSPLIAIFLFSLILRVLATILNIQGIAW